MAAAQGQHREAERGHVTPKYGLSFMCIHNAPMLSALERFQSLLARGFCQNVRVCCRYRHIPLAHDSKKRWPNLFFLTQESRLRAPLFCAQEGPARLRNSTSARVSCCTRTLLRAASTFPSEPETKCAASTYVPPFALHPLDSPCEYDLSLFNPLRPVHHVALNRLSFLVRTALPPLNACSLLAPLSLSHRLLHELGKERLCPALSIPTAV